MLGVGKGIQCCTEKLETGNVCGVTKVNYFTLSEQIAYSAVDLHLKEVSEFLHGSEMNKNPTLP